MTNLEARPTVERCAAGGPGAAGVELVEPRLVPLGGVRAMTVRRTLPSRARSLVGPFCFLDHYGPDDVADSGGMDVPPHPHTGLQTVTWLFEGHVRHQDATGAVRTVAPGGLNLMTAGHGVCHSEEGTTALFPDQRRLHGVQLWTALPEAARHGAPAFQHVADLPVVEHDGARVRVVLGTLLGASSAGRTFSPCVAAQLDVPAGAVVDLPVDAGFEHAVLVDAGEVRLDGTVVPPAWLGYRAPGPDRLRLVVGPGGPARLVLVGGAPFTEPVLMWWNFVGRTHDEVVSARAAWQAAIAGDADGLARFGSVPGYPGPALPAPDLPNVRLRPRDRPVPAAGAEPNPLS
ncbi:pirin family protein [Cellulomonas endophytica]|uniref:pirin family protein n=1 Tax=Cellulomonas endophytica TaxID=2494735 RepID=UPI0010113D5D|nr:pirin family protein [Cellulomonas endophytica]